MFRITFVKHSLAAAAVATAIVLTGPPAFADGPACGVPATDTPSVPTPAYNEPVTPGPGSEPCEEVAFISDGGPRDDAETGSVTGPQAAPAPGTEALSAMAPATVLPNTGGVEAWMTPVGLGSALAGLLVVLVARRRRA